MTKIDNSGWLDDLGLIEAHGLCGHTWLADSPRELQLCPVCSRLAQDPAGFRKMIKALRADHDPRSDQMADAMEKVMRKLN